MIEVWAYTACAGVWIGIVFGWLIPMIRQRIVYEIYAAFGVGIMICLIVLRAMVWKRGDMRPLWYIGYALFIPAVVLVIPAFITLKRKGKPRSGWEHTTVLINSGIFRVVRHPLYLGGAILTLGMVLVVQSVPSVISGIVATFCYWMASKKEEKFNIEKFGENYQEYMKNVPRWNPIKGTRK
jgi:protein-S-isoprenylcysteine O-methyltransferase Ste14